MVPSGFRLTARHGAQQFQSNYIKLINNIIHEIIAYINANPEQYYVIEWSKQLRTSTHIYSNMQLADGCN